MAKTDGIAVEHPIKAAWKEVWGLQGEVLSLCELYRVDNCPEVAWSLLAEGVLARLSDAVEALEGAYRDAGMSPLTSYEVAHGESSDGGMGAMAPMVTKVPADELITSRE